MIKKRGLFLPLLLALMLMLAGCQAERRPSIGESAFVLGKYDLEEEGLAQLVDELRYYMEMPATLRVGYFSAELTKKGVATGFTLTLHSYGEDKEYAGSYGFTYTEADGLAAGESDYSSTQPQYNENADLAFLDAQLKRLPLKEQLKLLDFPRYVLQYNGTARPQEGQPIVDGANGKAFPLLTLEEVQAGQGGVSNGSSGVYFSLGDGTGVTSENLLYFRFDVADEETVTGNRDYFPEVDYKINNGVFYFTTDYGESWTAAELPEDDVYETTSFYRNGGLIPEQSYFADSDTGVMALIYGELPSLLLSRDGGESWVSMDLAGWFHFNEGWYQPVTKRIVHFLDESNGYIGLGTDWSMGGGEEKLMLYTHDGGETWGCYTLPLNISSQVLSGLAFADAKAGVATMKHQINQEDPAALFYTLDGGESWTEFFMDDIELPQGFEYIYKVYSLRFEDNLYHIELAYGDKRASYMAQALEGPWDYEDDWQAKAHYNG